MDLMPKEYKQAGGAGAFGKIGALGNFKLPKAPNVSLKPWLILAFGILILTLGIFGSLKFYTQSLTEKIQQQRDEKEAIMKKLDQPLIEKIVELESGTEILKNLLKSHRYPSQLIEALAAATLPQAQWTDFSFSAESNKLILKGRVADYNVLARQLLVFKNEKPWTQVNFSGVALDKSGGVGVNLNLTFDPDILMRR